MSVPILFNKVYDGVQKAIGESSGLKQALFKKAMAVAREKNELLEYGKPVGKWLDFKHSIADKVVLSKIRERLGEVAIYVCGRGCNIGTSFTIFEDIGLPICEGYGLTETSPVISTGAPNWHTRRLGCVGVPLPGNTMYIRDPATGEELPPDTDGEICTAGRHVMRGYRNNDAANKEGLLQRTWQEILPNRRFRSYGGGQIS